MRNLLIEKTFKRFERSFQAGNLTQEEFERLARQLENLSNQLGYTKTKETIAAVLTAKEKEVSGD